MVASYIPDRGDLIWLQFSPQTGHEQAGHRPGIVLSPQSYNEKVGLALCCPITIQKKSYPFEAPLTEPLKTSGVILADQIKSLDCRKRNTQFMERVPESVINETLGKIHALL